MCLVGWEMCIRARYKIVNKKGVWTPFFIVKQQGSRVPNRCEASWKGGVLIYLTIILYKPFVGHTIKCKCMVDTFCGFFHNNGALDLHSNFIQLFFSPLQDSLLFVNK